MSAPAPDEALVHFSLTRPTDAGIFFALRALRGHQTLGGLYEYVLELELPAGAGLDRDRLAALLDAPAKLAWIEEDVAHARCGVLRRIEHLGTGTDGRSFYAAALVPRLWRASQTRRSRVFREATLRQLFERVCLSTGMSTDDLRWEVSATSVDAPVMVQYEESDLAFLSRRLEHAGVWLRFSEQNDRDVVIAVDGPTDKRLAPVFTYEPSAGLRLGRKVTALRAAVTPTVTAVRVRDHQLESPAAAAFAEQLVADDGRGVVALYGENFSTDAKNKSLLSGPYLGRVRGEEAACRAFVVRGAARALSLRVGECLTLEQHPYGWPDDTYQLVSVVHEFRQRTDTLALASSDAEGFDALDALDALGDERAEPSLARALGPVRHATERLLRTRFEAVPADVRMRPPRATAKPRIAGILTGVIAGATTGSVAPVDDNGCYTVVLPFDAGGGMEPRDAPQGSISGVRLAMATGGTTQGAHIPLRVGTVVAVAFAHGDPDRPVLLGALPAGEGASPVTKKNATAAIVRSFAAGIEIELEDHA